MTPSVRALDGMRRGVSEAVSGSLDCVRLQPVIQDIVPSIPIFENEDADAYFALSIFLKITTHFGHSIQ